MCFAGREIAVGLLICVRVCNVCGFVSEWGKEGVILGGEVGAECGSNGVGEGERRDVVKHSAGVGLSSY